MLAGPPAGDGPATFQLTSALVGLRREFLAAYISVSSSPQRYGAITVLRLPTDSQALGPQQVQTRFRSSAAPSGNGAPTTAVPGAQQASPEIQQAVATMAAALQQLQDAKAAENFAAEGQALAELDAATTRFKELTAES